MSFPYHDPNWVAAADFLKLHVREGDSILSPDLFWWRFPQIERYRALWQEPAPAFDWVVVHKGELAQLPAATLQALVQAMSIPFANAVFVILAGRGGLPDVDREDAHVKSLEIALAYSLASGQDGPPPDNSPELHGGAQIRALPSLDDAGLEAAMDDFWRGGGYLFPTLRDQVYFSEMDRHIREMAGPPCGRDVLDLCCGIGRVRDYMQGDRVVGVELSSVAVGLARERHAGIEGFRFEQMDAHGLRFADASFDLVLFVDSAEHVRDAGRVLAEAARVLRPGGLLVLTVANRDSLNQFMTRKLGYPEFVTNHHHFREYSWAESLAMVQGAGLGVVRTAGIFLFPYWGVPGLDQVVRDLTDNDPETVERMRVLGELAGAEHAYVSVLLARKPGGASS